ncbi:MAG: hypothetical protein E7661_10685 [Ruminococcaceae bacterium]|nr:hypothetical protein [Oscillospiraceae bacterium]
MNETNKIYHHTPMQRKDSELCVGICPYYLRDRGNGMVYCECARFRFPDKLARREIVYGFCAHPENYKKCAFKQMMDHFYERKYSMIDADERGERGLEEKA